MEQHLPGGIIPSSGLNENSKAYLGQTVRWTNFLAILGFISIGLMLFFSLLIILGGGIMMNRLSEVSSFGTIGYTLFGILYLGISILYFFPVFYLYKFGRLMKSGLLTDNELQITEAFRYQRNMYRFMGIMALIVIGIYILIFVFGALGAASGGFR
ncbi:hypothetical protein D3C71_89990 [compost metagenome]